MQNGTHKRSGLGRWWSSMWNSPMPAIGCEISQSGVSVARWSTNSLRLESAAWKPMPPGALEASPLRDNILKPDELQRAFSEALAALGVGSNGERSKPTDAILVIPDQAARLFVLNFDTFPEKESEGLPLVKWRLKKSLPFDIESAAVSYFVQSSEGAPQVVAVASPLSIVGQYESAAERAGLRPRYVTLSTLAAVNLLNGPEQDDVDTQAGVVVIKYSPPAFTIAILQGGTLRLFRTVNLTSDQDGLPLDEVLAAVYPSLAYFQDNFQQSVTRGYLCGVGENAASIAAALEQELNLKTRTLIPGPDSLATTASPSDAERHFAALLGISQEQLNA